MKPTLLTTLLLAAGLAATTHAHEKNERSDDDRRDHRSSRGRDDGHMDCSRGDRRHAREDNRSRKSRRDCDDPPVILHSNPGYAYGYLPPYPLYAPYPLLPPWYGNGRFVPIPIPRRPVYLLPGMR